MDVIKIFMVEREKIFQEKTRLSIKSSVKQYFGLGGGQNSKPGFCFIGKTQVVSHQND
jgi:hypothetical protein